MTTQQEDPTNTAFIKFILGLFVMFAERQVWIDVVKGFCIFLVVIFHAQEQIVIPTNTIFSNQLDAFAESFWPTFNWLLKSVRMPVFFALSGLLAARHIFSPDTNTVVEKRVFNLLWIFVIWTPILWLIMSLINIMSDFQSPLVGRDDLVLYSTTASDFLFNILKANGGLWYIYALVVYFVICWIGRGIPHILFAALLLLNFIMYYFPPAWAEWGVLSLVRHCVYFCFGAFYGAMMIRLVKERPAIYAISLVALLVLSVFVKWSGNDMRFFSAFAAIFGAIWLGMLLENILRLRLFAFLHTLGRSTLWVYIFHIPLLGVFGLILSTDVASAWLSESVIGSVVILLKPFALAVPITILSIMIGRFLQSHIPFAFAPPSNLQLSRS